MDQLELDAELDRIRERARRRYWSRLPVAIVVMVAVLVALIVWLPDDTGEEHLSVVLNVLDGLMIVFLFVSIAVIWRRFRRTGRPFFRWQRERSLALGLPRRQRRQVVRDIRRGTPSDDPLLRAVENAEVARLEPMIEMSLSYLPIMPVFVTYQGVRKIVLHGPAIGTFYLCTAALVLYSAVYTLRCRRGMRAFG